MSSSGTDMTTAGIGAAAGYPGLNVGSIQASVENGNSQAKQAYVEGLAFESMLVNELSQQMAGTMYGGQGAGSDGAAGSGGDSSSGGLLSGAGAYASLIPQTLTTSIMDSGGLGLAAQFAQEIDPSLAVGSGSQNGVGTTTGTEAATSAETATGAETDPQVPA